MAAAEDPPHGRSLRYSTAKILLTTNNSRRFCMLVRLVVNFHYLISDMELDECHRAFAHTAFAAGDLAVAAAHLSSIFSATSSSGWCGEPDSRASVSSSKSLFGVSS